VPKQIALIRQEPLPFCFMEHHPSLITIKRSELTL
jgi:hypothetical protein